MSHHSIRKLEKAEAKRTITLKNLENIAAVLDC
ncbi:hypothetical protein [Candidatus Odyssella thessalonicensis]